MGKPRGGYINYLKKPSQHSFDFEPLIKSLAGTRKQLVDLQKACGVRTSMYWESGQAIDVIDTIAVMLPNETNAEERIIPPPTRMHSI